MIEKMWPQVKACLRKECGRRRKALCRAVADALAAITVDDAFGWGTIMRLHYVKQML